MFIRTWLLLFLGLFAMPQLVSSQCSDWDKLFYYKFVLIGDAAHDRFGNTYIVGSFFEDGFTLGSNTFTLPVGHAGAFIAKFDKNHTLVWAMSPSAGYRAFGRQIEIGPDDNLIVAGDFDTSISFGCQSLPGSGRSDIFLVKLTPNGEPLWITGSTGRDDSNVEKITMSPNGNCILAGVFVERSDVTPDLMAPDVRFGDVPIITGATDQVSAGYDSFVASINPDGTVKWTQGIGGDGNNYDYALDITTDSRDNVIVTGYFNSEYISFDGHLVHRHQISENYFLAKIDAEGETVWVRETEGGINQSGWGVDTDAFDNIYVTGRYYGDAKFGSFNLPGHGDADIFVVKLTPDGNPVSARRFGSDGFDAGTGIHVNSQNKVIVSAYYYSNYLEVGTFSSSKSDLTGADSFIATLTHDLGFVECVNFITGDGESIIWKFDLDAFDNAIAIIDLMAWEGYEVNFGSQIFSHSDYWSVMAIVGDNAPPDADETPIVLLPQVSLGKDTTLCAGEKLLLSVGTYCYAEYKWSTGSTDSWIEVMTPGIYWVELTWNGNTVRDEIAIAHHIPPSVTLGNDRSLCAGEVVLWSLPLYEGLTYEWSDGTSSHENSGKAPGTYWIQVANRCETARASVTLQAIGPPEFDLGNDIVSCQREVTLNYTPTPGETMRWSDGSTSPSLMVTQSGVYHLTVDNGCSETTKDVRVTIKKPDDLVIPNVVTANGDGKNDHFRLPSDTEKFSLLIYNRWGQQIFHMHDYKNDWPTENHGAGVYYYTLQGECIPERRGIIHLLR